MATIAGMMPRSGIRPRQPAMKQLSERSMTRTLSILLLLLSVDPFELLFQQTQRGRIGGKYHRHASQKNQDDQHRGTASPGAEPRRGLDSAALRAAQRQ